jgi:hypothetical protein
LVLAFALAAGDYLLWNWSLNGNHDVLALISGLTLPPLAVVFLWLLALSVASALASSFRRPSARSRAGHSRARRRRPAARRRSKAIDDASSASANANADAGKLAA